MAELEGNEDKYKIKRGRPANPFCPVCRERAVANPQKRVAPGRKCVEHEKEYMRGANKTWSRRNSLRNSRIKYEGWAAGAFLQGQIGAALEYYEELIRIEKALEVEYQDCDGSWPVSPSDVSSLRPTLDRAFKTKSDTEHHRMPSQTEEDELYDDAPHTGPLGPPRSSTGPRSPKQFEPGDDQYEAFKVLEESIRQQSTE